MSAPKACGECPQIYDFPYCRPNDEECTARQAVAVAPMLPGESGEDYLERLRRHVGQGTEPADERDTCGRGMDVDPSGNWAGVRTLMLQAQRNAAKPRPDLLPANALLDAGRAMAQRVDRDIADEAPGFLAIPSRKYRASLLRHVLAYLAGDR